MFDSIKFPLFYLKNDRNFPTFVMKYSELERKLKFFGCYELNRQQNGHPLWYSPITDKVFKMSNHKNFEVPKGTLKRIKIDSGC